VGVVPPGCSNMNPLRDEHVLLVRYGGALAEYTIECTSFSKAAKEIETTLPRPELGWGYRILPLEHDVSVMHDDVTRATWIKPKDFPICLAIVLCQDCQVRFFANRRK